MILTLSLILGYTPALACAPNKDVADCLALILATMMPISSSSPLSSLTFNAINRYTNTSKTVSFEALPIMRNEPSSYCSFNNIGGEQEYLYTDVDELNDSDSETYWQAEPETWGGVLTLMLQTVLFQEKGIFLLTYKCSLRECKQKKCDDIRKNNFTGAFYKRSFWSLEADLARGEHLMAHSLVIVDFGFAVPGIIWNTAPWSAHTSNTIVKEEIRTLDFNFINKTTTKFKGNKSLVQ